MSVQGMDRNRIIQAVTSGLMLAEAQESGVPPSDITTMQEIELNSEQVLSGLNDLIDIMLRNQRLWLANNVDALITAAADGEKPTGSNKYTKERWQELRAIFLSFNTWLNTPIMLLADEEGTPTGPIPLISLAKQTQ